MKSRLVSWQYHIIYWFIFKLMAEKIANTAANKIPIHELYLSTYESCTWPKTKWIISNIVLEVGLNHEHGLALIPYYCWIFWAHEHKKMNLNHTLTRFSRGNWSATQFKLGLWWLQNVYPHIVLCQTTP